LSYTLHCCSVGYARLSGTPLRTDADSHKYFPLMILAHVILTRALVWITARGLEAKAWLAQGVRFSLAVALPTIVPTHIIYYAVQPMPGSLVVNQILFDRVLMLLLGVIVAWLHRHQAAG
jgi:hypothetical protein